MRSFRAARLLVLPMVVLPLVLSTVVLSGTAWAKGHKGTSTKLTCQEVTGTVSNWQLAICLPPANVGSGTTNISTPFPTVAGTHTVKFTWSSQGLANPRDAGTTTFLIKAKPLTGRHDKCANRSQEIELTSGKETKFTGNANLKGRVKAFVCVSTSQALSAYKPFKL